ncbi:MAG: hypothetical protein ACQPRJ_03680 [Solitalea-like symbiont of Acarus siro]
MATKLQIPILPITIVDTWKIIHNNGLKRGIGFGTMNVVIHEPIMTKNLSDSDISTLSDRVYKVISSAYCSK